MGTPIAVDPSEITLAGTAPAAPAMMPKAAAGGKVQPIKVDPSEVSFTAPPSGENAVLSRGHPWQDAAFDVGRLGAFIGGEEAGGPMGAGVAGTAVDAAEAALHSHQTGLPSQITGPNLQKDMLANAAGAYAGDVIGPAIGKGLTKVGNNIIGKTALQEGAMETAGAAEQAGAKAYGKQAAANLAERSDTYQSTASQAGNQRLAAGANAADAATAVQDQLAQTHAKAAQQATEGAAKVREGVAKQLQPEARTATVQSALGRTPQQTQTAIRGNVEQTADGAIPGPAMANRQTQFWDAFYSPIRRTQNALSNAYDKLFAGKEDVRVPDASSLQQAIADEEGYAGTSGKSYSAASQKLLARGKNLAPTTIVADDDANAQALKLIQQDPSAFGLDKKGALTERQLAHYRDSFVKSGIIKPTQGGAGPTIAEIRGLRSDALQHAVSATSSHDRALGHNIAEAADDMLAKSGALNPKEQAQLDMLNTRYRSSKTIFDRSLVRKVGGAAEPTDVAGEIFNDPKRFSLVTANATPDQLSTLRRTYADWVNVNGDKVIKPEHAPDLKKLFPGTPLADPKAWIYQDKALVKLDDIIKSSPEVQQKAMRMMGEQFQQMRTNAASGVMADAQKQLPTLGNFGIRVMQQMKAAKTPEDAVKIYTQAITGMQPEDLIKEATSGMPSGSEAGANAVSQLTPTQKPPEMAQREAIMNTQSPQAAKAGMAPPTTPDEAAIQGIQMGKAGSGSKNSMIARMSRNWPLYAAVVAASAASGHRASPYMTAMAGMGVALVGSEGLRAIYYKQLAENPEAAAAMYQALMNPGTESNFRKLMGMVAKGAVQDAGAKLTKMTTGATLEPKADGDSIEMPIVKSPAEMKVDGEPGPAIKAIERSHAEAVSPVPSAADRAAKVAKDMSAGKAPAIHKDLREGRLSMDEVNQLLKRGSRKDAMAMVDGIPPDKAMDAAEVGTPEEKQFLLPLIRQKMAQQMRNSNYNRTAAASLAKRYQALMASVPSAEG